MFFLAYRNALHETTAWTVCEMLFGRMFRLSCDILWVRILTCLPRLTNTLGIRRHVWIVNTSSPEKKFNLVSDCVETSYDISPTGDRLKKGDRVCLYNLKSCGDEGCILNYNKTTTKLRRTLHYEERLEDVEFWSW